VKKGSFPSTPLLNLLLGKEKKKKGTGAHGRRVRVRGRKGGGRERARGGTTDPSEKKMLGGLRSKGEKRRSSYEGEKKKREKGSQKKAHWLPLTIRDTEGKTNSFRGRAFRQRMSDSGTHAEGGRS